MGNTLRELLGVDLPIVQAPMAGVQDHALAVAVSNSGGLGRFLASLAGRNVAGCREIPAANLTRGLAADL